MKTFYKVWLSIALIAIVFGIGILIIIVGTGANWRDIPTYSLEESYDGIDKIDMEIGYGDVKIVEGDTFSIEAKNLLDENLESYVSDGTWIIKEDEDYLRIFGMRLSVKQLVRWNDDLSPRITITIPSDFVAENIDFHISAGSVQAEEIEAENGNFEVEAGRLEINQLIVKEKSSYNIGAGEMILKNLEVNDITVDCGVGNVVIEGTVTGENEITCGVGKVDLKVIGEEEDYSYEVNSGIGNVTINNNSFNNMSNHIINNDGADNFFHLDCGIGNIIVEFK
jgi:hypothetical protein